MVELEHFEHSVIRHLDLGEQHVHVAGKSASHRMDGEKDGLAGADFTWLASEARYAVGTASHCGFWPMAAESFDAIGRLGVDRHIG